MVLGEEPGTIKPLNVNTLNLRGLATSPEPVIVDGKYPVTTWPKRHVHAAQKYFTITIHDFPLLTSEAKLWLKRQWAKEVPRTRANRAAGPSSDERQNPLEGNYQ